MFWSLGFWVSEFPGLEISGCSGLWVSGSLCSRVSRSLGVLGLYRSLVLWVSGSLSFGVSGFNF